jgi:hypothetical protein
MAKEKIQVGPTAYPSSSLCIHWLNEINRRPLARRKAETAANATDSAFPPTFNRLHEPENSAGITEITH